MVTVSEQKNPEEDYADDSLQLRRPLSSGIIGLTDGLTYTSSEANRSPVAPNQLTFDTIGMSNGLSSKINGITDFVAYNPYIHHHTVGNASAGISEALNNAGIGNFNSSTSTQINVMNTLVVASKRFEIYSRQFRV
jgi:hypothetical protein